MVEITNASSFGITYGTMHSAFERDLKFEDGVQMVVDAAVELMVGSVEEAKRLSMDPAGFVNSVLDGVERSIHENSKRVGLQAREEKILYDALDIIKAKSKEDPIKIFNSAISNVKPNVECRSRRVGGATYQVPVEVKTKRSQTLALRWLLSATRKRKSKKMSLSLFQELMDAYQKKGSAIKKREDTHKMAESNKAFAHFRW